MSNINYSPNILLPIGVRPHAIKALCLAKAAENSDVNFTYLLTNQQSDIIARMLPEKEASLLKLRSVYTKEVFSYRSSSGEIARVAKDCGAHAIMSVGDTKTSLCAAIGAGLAKLPLIHYESGLRGIQPTLEERIRRKIDSVTALHLCYNNSAVSNLTTEGVRLEHIRIVGSLYEESLSRCLTADASYDGRYRGYLVVALHRKENHLNARMARKIASAIQSVGKPVLFVKHPSNSAEMLAVLGTAPYNWTIESEFRCDEFAHVMKNAAGIVTDSAGIAEQSSLLSIPTVILRQSTERPWLLSNMTRCTTLASLSETIADVSTQRRPPTTLNTYTSTKICEAIKAFLACVAGPSAVEYGPLRHASA